MLPVKDGFTVVSEMRGAGQFVPTLMLTARGRPEDVLEGFAAGRRRLSTQALRTLDPDRPHPRPAAPQAVAALDAAGPAAKSGAIESFAFGEKSIHFDLLEVHAGGKVYPLTLMEASILRFLVDQEGKAVSRKSMLQEVWGLREDTDTRAIDNFIVRLRRYVEDDPAKPRHLVTVRGIGYRFVASPE